MSGFDAYQRRRLFDFMKAVLSESQPMDNDTLYLTVIDHVKANEPGIEDNWVDYYWEQTIEWAVDKGKLYYVVGEEV